MLGKLATGDLAIALVVETVVAVHVAWLRGSDHAGEVLAGLGAALQVLGLLAAARSLFRAGVSGLAAQQVPAPQPPYLDDENYSITRAARVAYQERVKAAWTDVLVERVIAVVVIGAGTALNGYGTPIARWLGMRI